MDLSEKMSGHYCHDDKFRAGAGTLSLGVIGTALGGLALAKNSCGCGSGGGLLGGLFGGNCGCGCDKNDHDTRIISGLEAALAVERSERYADNVGIDTFKSGNNQVQALETKMNGLFRETFNAIAENDKNIALNKQASEFQFMFVNKEFDCLNGKVAALTHRVNCITKEVVPISAICPQPLAACVPITASAQIIPTSPAPTEGEIALRSAAVK